VAQAAAVASARARAAAAARARTGLHLGQPSSAALLVMREFR
jgi:hypothetical protein